MALTKKETKDPLILKEDITNINSTTNKLFNICLLLGSGAFFITGLNSYLLTKYINTTYIVFYPQGLTMCIYGTLGILLSINQIIKEYFKIGEGYNEFNKRNGKLKIFRKKEINKNIYLKYEINDIVKSKIIK